MEKDINGVEVVFLNATGAYEYQRDHSHYIQEQIQQIDVSIVLEQDLSNKSLTEVRQLYLDNLAANTLNWTEKETRNFNELLGKVFNQIVAVNPNVLPDTLYMIKSSGNETIGSGAMYTSAKSLTIPRINTRSAGFGFLEDEVKETLIHELFHIYSNLNKDKRADIYDIVGFYPIELDLGDAQSRIIANPDADFGWAVELTRGEEVIEAVLLTYSTHARWEGKKSTLGLKPAKGYLDYGLFEVVEEGGVYTLKNGLTKLNMNSVEGSFRYKVGNNTDYLWAVEEIIADTYPLIFMGNDSASERDQEIIDSLEEVLR
ncbi:MAG: hypothetical protein WBB45_05075 [Cyclobacteriaceae bacterium]